MKKIVALIFGLQCVLGSYACQQPLYTVNLMWVNSTLKQQQKYIHPIEDEQEMRTHFLDRIFAWARIGSPDSIVQVWYDSQMSSPQAVANTQELIVHQQKEESMVPIVLKDVRTLEKVAAHPDAFSDLFPVFFRVDLLRIIAAEQAITNHQTANFVYTDLDVIPLSKEHLFNKDTTQKLQRFGTVMTYHETFKLENNFFILTGHNENLLKALRCAQIDLNLKRAEKLFAYKKMLDNYDMSDNANMLSTFGKSKHDAKYCLQGCMNHQKQQIYDSYHDMFDYFFHLEGMGTAILRSPQHVATEDDFNELRPFCLLVSPRLGNMRKYSFCGHNRAFCTVPTKLIQAPASGQICESYDHTRVHEVTKSNQTWEFSNLIENILAIEQVGRSRFSNLCNHIVSWSKEHLANFENDSVGYSNIQERIKQNSHWVSWDYTDIYSDRLIRMSTREIYQSLPTTVDEYSKCKLIVAILVNLTETTDFTQDQAKELLNWILNILPSIKHHFNYEYIIRALANISQRQNLTCIELFKPMRAYLARVISKLNTYYCDLIRSIESDIIDNLSGNNPDYAGATYMVKTKLEPYFLIYNSLQTSIEAIVTCKSKYPDLLSQKDWQIMEESISHPTPQ